MQRIRQSAFVAMASLGLALAAVARNCGTSQVRVTQADVRTEVRKDGEAASVVKVEPVRTFYEVQVIRACDPRFHKAYLRVDSDGSSLK